MSFIIEVSEFHVTFRSPNFCPILIAYDIDWDIDFFKNITNICLAYTPAASIKKNSRSFPVIFFHFRKRMYKNHICMHNL